ncbi:MAG TPA: hypothetical protein GX523_06685 [Desulfitobacterium dehalogenans]|uniref:Uncharacterized protein n=1 Tax=Desulfitobacterium dehalogenans TaxID=36854 RepID=A0A7C6Z3V2_9FIRM|nr:hypothetical protein [Desulfitobacterium dehalogenans]
MTEYHCEYCYCPKDIWKKCLTTYDGDECKLYDSFSSLIPFDDDITPQRLGLIARNKLPREFPDIIDIDATVTELVSIALDCGVIKEGGA